MRPYLFVETLVFSHRRAKLFEDDEDFAKMQQALMSNPEQGKVIAGTGGLRKLRWAESSRGKGKRSGLRVIYLHFERFGRLYLVTAYSKDESDDLTAKDKGLFKALSQRIEAELQQKGKERERSS